MQKPLRSVGTLLLCFGLSCGIAYALPANSASELKITQQASTCTGIVKDATGEAIIGASVVVKGTTNGTITGFDGDFSIANVNKGAVLVVSYIGYKTLEVKWNGEPLNISLSDDTQLLSEVVVTALGMKRDKKALGYAMTEMKGEDLNSNVINPVSALQGKVAGVEISQSDGGLFGSNKILIRGASTLGKNNQPIYVVDGVLLDNSINDASADWDSNSNDYGNELKNLNPDDFETVSVLKGAAATALYGSRGLNGAVVITTKSGKSKKGLGINFSQTVGIDVITAQPDLQNVYGEGYLAGYVDYGEKDQYGEYKAFDNFNQFFLNTKDEHTLIGSYGMGFGPAFDGSPIEYYDGSIRPYSAQKNNYRDAHRTGFNSNTNVSISGGNDRTTFYTSLSYKYADGTIDNNSFNRISFLGKASHKLSDKVELEAGFTFANSSPKNAQINIGESFIDGTFSRLYDPNTDKHRYKGSHGGLASSAYGDEYANIQGKGLWWSIFENDFRQKETVVRPMLKINADITSWLKFVAEGSYNYYYTRYENKRPDSSYANQGTGGYYSMSNTTKEQTNLNVNFNVNKQLKDLELHGFIRGEYYHSFGQTMKLETDGGLIVPNQYFIGNSRKAAKYSGSINGEKTMLSVVGQVGASYKDMLFIDVTGRNDWSSSLVYGDGHGTYSYFYPSISGSWLITSTFREMLPSWISFAKLRASWAQVGNDTEPYIINSAYSLSSSTVGSNNIYGAVIGDTSYSKDLKPERKSSWEVGLDWRFIENRIGVDFTYYKENTKDQIMKISVPYMSGIKYQYVNAGNIQNSGIELAINAVPVRTNDFEWGLNFTYTRNRSKIISLHENVADYIVLQGDVGYGNYRVGSVAKVGGAYGLILTDSGKKIDPSTGLPYISYHASTRTGYYTRSGQVEELGSINPDFLGSVSTSLKYKNWTLNVGLDARFGGYVASYGSKYGTAYGYTKKSLDYTSAKYGGLSWISKWDNTTYYDGVIPEGVIAKGTVIAQPDGSKYTVGVGSVSTNGETYKELIDKGYIEPTHSSGWTYRNNQWVNASFDRGVVNDAWFKKLNYIALRDVSLSYRMPSKIYSKIGAKNMNLTLSGHNLGYLLNSMPNGENPEAVRGTAAAEFRVRSFDGVTSSFTFTVNASF
ncbi:SusC/RagA family TonB-linked outer membrane protein [Phocaeicola paurosaccharolyticus]|jgi:iron complex outermembrane recepter protein|uniref:SusC/RagA family TonB-linked outer membrane protein n=1 Tax=Phocaeicola paurosaccharolyticus TaxID=732242 RepID=UPI0004681EF4|nr:SusC/RagA family TonB-linked outer membrane protein [Phocaeicola paurosaccharolyticus]